MNIVKAGNCTWLFSVCILHGDGSSCCVYCPNILLGCLVVEIVGVAAFAVLGLVWCFLRVLSFGTNFWFLGSTYIL
ncbi:hypothetical protein ES332_A01G247900v1 [Gossypium tomentosum]|uniref:Transmembrane protein n=1 Tax=Gossypium tomentosum TaxID=34277 RepID=A0A5D2RUN6_GOSTO|nr:hypothetical protein ES332_A01G247900v1 [Gossypium tomentosum]